jgi:hypothetical protein
MSGLNSKHGGQVFDLTGPGTPRPAATRRQQADAALIRHRQKVIPPNVTGGNLNVWMRYLAWQLERENAILRYRDGNDQQEEC